MLVTDVAKRQRNGPASWHLNSVQQAPTLFVPTFQLFSKFGVRRGFAHDINKRSCRGSNKTETEFKIYKNRKWKMVFGFVISFFSIFFFNLRFRFNFLWK